MLLHVANVLTAEEVAHCRRRLDAADWLDGRLTAGYQSAKAKHNLQLADDSPVARELGALILDKLQRHPTFVAGALPRRIFPPLFNCYREGQSFGFHVDNAVRYPRTGDEGRMALQLVEYQRAELARDRAVVGQLQVVLGLGGLVAGRQAAVQPVGRVEAASAVRDFFGGQYVGDMEQHGDARRQTGGFMVAAGGAPRLIRIKPRRKAGPAAMNIC